MLYSDGLPIFGFGATTTTSVVSGVGCASCLGFFVATVLSMCVIGLEFNLEFSSCAFPRSDRIEPVHALVTRTADPVDCSGVGSLDCSGLVNAFAGVLADPVAVCQFLADLAGAGIVKCVHTPILLVFLPACTQFLDLGSLFLLGAHVTH